MTQTTDWFPLALVVLTRLPLGELTCTASRKKLRLKPFPDKTNLLVTVIKIEEAQ